MKSTGTRSDSMLPGLTGVLEVGWGEGRGKGPFSAIYCEPYVTVTLDPLHSFPNRGTNVVTLLMKILSQIEVDFFKPWRAFFLADVTRGSNERKGKM